MRYSPQFAHSMPITRRKFIQSGILFTAGVAFLDAFWIEKYFIDYNEFYFGNATKSTTNIKVIQLSDLHLQAINSQLKNIANRLNELQPNLILITGDAIDKAENISILDEFLQMIDNSIQKVAILGNWEYWGNIDFRELEKIYSKNNCRLLINQTTQYSFDSKTISITGVDDFVGGDADIELALKEYKQSDHHIILNHCPQYSDQIDEKMNRIKADFILSGHTHGGQISLFGYIPFLPRGSGRYLKGWYNDNSPSLYVSRGIGTSIIPARFFARAEVAIFNL